MWDAHAASEINKMAETSEAVGQALLHGFQLERVLNEDARQKSACLLGHFTLPNGEKEDAIVKLEKTHFTSRFYQSIGVQEQDEKSTRGPFGQFQSLGSNDVYFWLLAWMSTPNLAASQEEVDAHVKLTVIRPATEAHILKSTEQSQVLITETPELYAQLVQPYIFSQPVERIQWVYNILDKIKEADTILYEDPQRFIILPDLKWDRITLSSLYLVAIVQDRTLRTMRDLTREHVPLLRDILQQGERVAQEKFALNGGGPAESKLRCFFHYQPTYYHLHVHLLSSDYATHPGAIVGQAHLVQDVIDMLELGVDMKQRTLSYSLGSRSPLLAHLRAHLDQDNADEQSSA